MQSNWYTKIVLLALIVLSVWLFWRRFGRVVERIRRAPPDADFRLSSIGKRVWRFFWEVMCQAKVIRERPLPGLAHAFVFWAFCAFALVTLNHVASAYGAAFLDRHAGAGVFYFWLAFAFALPCALGIAYLAFRRFVLRPKWLEPLSYESGVIALFIFLLMVSYMPMWWVSESSPTGRTL